MLLLQTIFLVLFIFILLFFLIIQFAKYYPKFRPSNLRPFPVFLFSMIFASIFLFMVFSLNNAISDEYHLTELTTIVTQKVIIAVLYENAQLHIIEHDYFNQQTLDIKYNVPATINSVSMQLSTTINLERPSAKAFLIHNGHFYFIEKTSVNPTDEYSIIKQSVNDPTTNETIFQNISVNGQSLAYDSVHNIFYVTSAESNTILKLNPTENSIQPISNFGHSIHEPKGLFFHDSVLYVCDKYRVLAFMNSHVVRIYEPVFIPNAITVWNNILVICAIDRTYFFDKFSAKHLSTLILSSLHVTSSKKNLYIAGQNQVGVYA